jgi:competence protein ComEC
MQYIRASLFMITGALLIFTQSYSVRNSDFYIWSANESVIAADSAADLLNETFEGLLRVRFFYLKAKEKSGSSILIQTPDEVTILIDAGTDKTGSQLKKYLDQLHIERIDYAIATHPHHDHIGGYLTILKSKQIGKILMTKVPNRTRIYHKLKKLIKKQKLGVKFLEEGDQLPLGDQISLEVLHPTRGTNSQKFLKNLSTPAINNLSLVLKLTYKDRSFLFTGDLYKAGELELIKRYGNQLDVDVLEAPHHGDSTSSSRIFIRKVSPKITLINANILQSKQIYERYLGFGCKVYSTGLDGTILVVSDGSTLKVVTEKNRSKN